MKELEAALAGFVADRAAARRSLPPMPREARAVAHALAEQYGLASRGAGQEPARCVELLRTPAAALPRRLLSAVAAGVAPSEVAALLREAEGHPVRVDSIALSCDLGYYLRRWEGGYRLEWEGGEAAVVRFERPEDRREFLDQVGGGIRGLFRVDRAWRPRTGVTGAPPSAAAAARGWGGGGGEAAAGGPSWASAAQAPPPAQQQQEAAQQQQQRQQQQQDGLRAGWAVISSRRAAKATSALQANGGQQAGRNRLALLLGEDGGEWPPEHGGSNSERATV